MSLITVWVIFSAAMPLGLPLSSSAGSFAVHCRNKDTAAGTGQI